MRNLKAALLGTALLAGAVSLGAYKYNFELRPPLVHLAHGAVDRIAADDAARCFQAKQKSWSKPEARTTWAICEPYLDRYGALEEFNEDFALMHLAGGLGAASIALLFGAAWMAGTPARHVRGPRLLRGADARRSLRRILDKECRRSGQGLAFPAGMNISRDRESRHFMITGGVGSGKTQTMRHLMVAAMQRGDKVLVLDTKGDVTAGLPGDYTLLAPQDRRSEAWDIAKDCVTKQDARELAARFIPKSDDPMWAEAARGLFVACVVSLLTEKPGLWTWCDLHRRLMSSPEVLRDIALRFYPAAAQLIDDPASKTALSILTTFKAFLPPVEALADAWGREDDFAFSLSGWLAEPSSSVPVILQRDGRYPQLSNVWISALIGLLSSKVGSPSLKESADRRIWLFLDEFPQLERMEEFTSLLDLGRSKGVCVVLAAQDTSQIRIRYGRDRTNAWLSMVGTHIVCRMNVGEGAEDISRALGTAEIDEPVRSKGHSGGRYSSSTSMQRRTAPVMTASEISSELGPRRRSVRVLIVGVAADYHMIDLPYCDFEPIREPHEPANWTLAGFAPPTEPVQHQTQMEPEAVGGLISASDLEAIRSLKSRDLN